MCTSKQLFEKNSLSHMNTSLVTHGSNNHIEPYLGMERSTWFANNFIDLSTDIGPSFLAAHVSFL